MPRDVTRNSTENMEKQRGLIIMSSFPAGQIMKIDWTVKKLFYFFTAFTENRLGLTFACYYFPLSFSSQSNWYDINAGNCNLLLIKTWCWHWLLTDDNSELSCSQFSFSPLLCFSFFPPTLPPWYFSLRFPLALYLIALFSILQSHHHEEEKRALRGEIIVLNNHLMEAKITINKLREDNVSTYGCLV